MTRLLLLIHIYIIKLSTSSSFSFITAFHHYPSHGYSTALSRESVPSSRASKMRQTNGSDDENDNKKKVIDLQTYHVKQSPAEVMQGISKSCSHLNVDEFDMYGDFTKDDNISYLRKFEKEVSSAFDMEDGVFMPSGVMAQNIALLIHSAQRRDKEDDRKMTFACHHSSHLLLHENDAYNYLLGINNPLVISTRDDYDKSNGIHIPPMRFQDVVQAFDMKEDVSTLILELPHRELGGKIAPWDDVVQIGKFCNERGVAYHCDGARLIEAAAGYGLPLPEIVQPFDSVYVSFYKGLGSISGAMLLGSRDFCNEARVWLRRFGGNLFTLLPYAVSSWAGYRKHVVADTNESRSNADGNRNTGEEDITIYSFKEKQEKLAKIVQQLSSDERIQKYITFDPPIPKTNMVHVYFKSSKEKCENARDETIQKTNIAVFQRIREEIRKESPANSVGHFQCYLEWTMGDANACINDELFLEGWKTFASCLPDK